MQQTRPKIRRSSAERRKQIVEAALRIIGRKGIRSLTMSVLAEEVGVTSGALFRHFASRGEILEEMASYAVEKLETTFPAQSLPPLERLLTLARKRVALLGGDPGLSWLMRSEQASLSLPPKAIKALRGIVQRSRSFLLEAIREGVEQQSIRNDIEAEILLIPVVGTIHALIGMPGVHRQAARAGNQGSEAVLDALALLLTPPRRLNTKQLTKGRARRPRRKKK